MIVVASPVSLPDSDIVSQPLSLRRRTSRRLSAVCAVAAALIAGSAAKGAAQTAHFAGARSTVGFGFISPAAVVVDGNGNVYVTDYANNAVKEILAVNGSIPASPVIRTLGSGFNYPNGVAVDGLGDVYVANSGDGTIKEMVAVNGSIPDTPSILTLTQIAHPQSVAVDASGNLVVSGGCQALSTPGTLCGFVEELLAVGGRVPANPGSLGLPISPAGPGAVAVDRNGNVYVADLGNNQVVEILATNGSVNSYSASRVVFSMENLGGLAVDSNGDIFVSQPTSNTVSEVLAVNGSIPNPLPSNLIRTLGTGFLFPAGISLDARGNLYVADFRNSRVVEFSPSLVNFDSVNVGASSSPIPVVFTFDTAGTLGSTAVSTQGAPGLDFADAGTSTCIANTAYIAGQACTINVVFTPKFSGMRYGAAVLYNTSGNVIASGYVQGTGVGPQLIFFFGPQSTIPAAGLSNPGQVAVDGSGSIYTTDWVNNRVLKETKTADTYTQSSIGTGFNRPIGVAVDGAGIVYIADTYNNRLVIETPSAGGYLESVAGSGLSLPMNVAVDGSGNIYVADYGNQRVLKETLSAGGYTQSVVASSGLNGPSGVAVDGSGNVYIADVFNNRVLKETPSAAGYAESTVPSNLLNPNGVTVDGNGTVYISDTGHDRVVKEFPSGSSYYFETVIAEGLNLPGDVALDGAGNLYVSNSTSVLKIDFADPPSLVFAPTAIGSTSVGSPEYAALGNIGNAPLSFPIPATGNNPSIAANFTLNSSGSGVCPLVSSGSFQPAVLMPGADCLLPISFAPETAGAISGSLVLTDNNLNAAAPGYATQTISLSGTGVQSTPVITWYTPHAISYGTALSADQLNATANVPGTFSYSPAAGTILPAGTDTLTVTFTPTDTVAYTTTTASITLNVRVASPAITWNTPAPITFGTALGAAQLNASSPVSGTFVYTPAAGSVLSAGQQTLRVTFTPTDSVDYSTASGSVLLTVAQATPVITWPTPAPIAYGTPLSATQLNASANVPGTFAYNPAAGSGLPAGTNTLTTTFTPTDSQDYATATASVLLSVTNFTLSASSIELVQNNSGGVTVYVVPYGGFTGSVLLSVSGVPNGVTASFGTNPTTTTSVLTFKVGPKATVGTSSVVVTGVSGGLTRTFAIPLTIYARK